VPIDCVVPLLLYLSDFQDNGPEEFEDYRKIRKRFSARCDRIITTRLDRCNQKPVRYHQYSVISFQVLSAGWSGRTDCRAGGIELAFSDSQPNSQMIESSPWMYFQFCVVPVDDVPPFFVTKT